MKKILLVFAVCLCSYALTSCFNTRILVGNVTANEPVVEVNKVWNHHLIFGLVPLDNATMKAAEYVNNAENYVVKTNMSFLNSLVGGITCGIYYPTQTKYYVPMKGAKQ